MHWYAWVCGPLEFLGAWWLVRPPKGASWSAVRKWFADFNSYPTGPSRPGVIRVPPLKIKCKHCAMVKEFYTWEMGKSWVCPRCRSEQIERGKLFPWSVTPYFRENPCPDCGGILVTSNDVPTTGCVCGWRPSVFGDGGIVDELLKEKKAIAAVEKKIQETHEILDAISLPPLGRLASSVNVTEAAYIEARDHQTNEILGTFSFPPPLRAAWPAPKDHSRWW